MLFMVDNIDIVNYADDNTTYSVGKSQCELEAKLQKASVNLFKLFQENGLKANQNKSDFLSSLNINTKFSLLACILENSDSQKLLGLTNMLPTYVKTQAKKFKHLQGFFHIYPKRKNEF